MSSLVRLSQDYLDLVHGSGNIINNLHNQNREKVLPDGVMVAQQTLNLFV